MNNISIIIRSLSSEEKKKFILGLRKKNKRNDTKNIKLFKILDTEVPLDHPDHLIYGKSAKSAYHALCKRLYDSLIDFIAANNIDDTTSKEIKALKLVLVARAFFQHQQTHLAIKTLAKAELIAKKNSYYNILNDIFQLQLSHTHLHDSLNFSEINQKIQENRRNMAQEENLNLFYASIQDELTDDNPQLSKIIERKLQEFNISITKNLSYQSLFKILQISNQIAHITRNYHDILEFIEKARKEIAVTKQIQNEQLYFHIQVLYYMANTYFRIKEFDTAALYLSRMHNNMKLQQKKYYRIFYCQYELLENLLFIYTGNLETAIDQLGQINFKMHKKDVEYVHDLKLTLIMALFLNERYHESLKIYQEFYHSDNWYTKKVGFIWVIKKNLLEIMLLIELNYIDLLESRLKSFRKKHSTHLIEHHEQRILDFVSLISKYHMNKEVIHSSMFNAKLDLILESGNPEKDIFAVSFYAWLKAKTISKNTYEVCLEFTNN